MKKRIFIINGSGGVGKDTFCEYVGKYAKVRVHSSVEEVKNIARLCGWSGSKEPKDRRFLSDLKDLLTKYNDLPFRGIQSVVKDFYKDSNEFLFIHIREPKEIERAKRAFKAVTILVFNDNVKCIYGNHADDEVLRYIYDELINNSGTLEDLDTLAKNFVEKWDESNYPCCRHD